MKWSLSFAVLVLALLALAIEVVEAGKTTTSTSKKTSKTTTKKTTKTTTATTSKPKKTKTTTATTISKKDDNKDVVNLNVYTTWVTVFETVNDCGPFTTTVTPCDICTPCVITDYNQCITSTTTSTWPTSTYCSTPGWYDECSCQISQPQWIWYDVPCEVEYSCPYQEWYFMDNKNVDCIVKVNGEICDEKKEIWTVTKSKTITKTITNLPKSKSSGRPPKKSTQHASIKPNSRSLPPPSSARASSVPYTIQPTHRPVSSVNPPASSWGPAPAPHSSGAPPPAPASSSSSSPPPAPGSPISTFKLTTTIGGSDVVIMQEGGLLVLTPAINSTTDVVFTLTSTGELMTSSGDYVFLTITDGVGGDFGYGPLPSDKRKRAGLGQIVHETFFGSFGLGGGAGLTLVIEGSDLTIQKCGDGNVLAASGGIMSGCDGVSVAPEPVDVNTTSTSITRSATGSLTSATGSLSGSVTGTTSSSTSGSTSGSGDPTTSATGSATGSANSASSTSGTSSTTGPTGSTSASASGSASTDSPSSTTTTDGPSPSGGDGGSSSTSGSPSGTGSTTDGPSGTGTTDPSSSSTSSSSEPTTTGPSFGNGTNSTTEARRVRMARAMKFKYI